MFIPPVSLPISPAAISLPLVMASWTPLRTRSSRNSASSGSMTDGSILMDWTSPEPVATTVTLPPPTEASTVLSASSSCAFAIPACIC